MSDEVEQIAHSLFEKDPTLITMAMLVILVPFLTGLVLLALRAVEIKKGSNFKFSESLTGYFGTAGLAISWVISIVVAINYFSHYVSLEGHGEILKVQGDFDFLPSTTGHTAFKWGILLDPLSVIFLVALTTIATAIHFYATHYMHADEAYTRFFGTLNFFTSSMLGFVLASNLFMSFIFWELLGFSSYLLIGYFWPKASAAEAARKAFMYNKVGDVAFVFSMGFLYPIAHTFDYVEIADLLHQGELTMAQVALPALFLFGAAVGKSAQVPLFGWLPEAMEGPTPVSALLHSSTMVKAGLYLIARGFFTFYEVHDLHVILPEEASVLTGEGAFAAFMTPANIIAWFGTFTALMGGLIALTATDIKKVLAFSTISQLGYIALAIGAGGLTAGFYHLISHATFKSLLFLCAGAVIHSVHSQEMSDMGGLKSKMPWTYRTMTVGLLGLMGFPFMNGFWSKDAVLATMKEADHISGNTFLWIVGLLTAVITAFYSTKLWFRTFHGDPRYDKEHVEPGPTSRNMKIALIFLAFFVVVESIWFSIGTVVNLAKGEEGLHTLLNFEYALGTMLGAHGVEFHIIDGVISFAAVAIGFGLAFFIYGGSEVKENILSNGIVQIFANIFQKRFYLDDLLYGFANNFIMPIGGACQWFDKTIIDETIIDYLVADRLALGGAYISDWTDMNIIDGFVKWISDVVSRVGSRLRGLQTGQVGMYARFMVLGIVIILSYFVLITLNVIDSYY
ncbi:MAG: hypothetical protein INQ03_04365 [Candidatus Heimdallarchaeota archaeon]|nr:hypothetical protein [Candidatus Heimdallarchaeota archaeon]